MSEQNAEDVGTHWTGCFREHARCAQIEIGRLRALAIFLATALESGSSSAREIALIEWRRRIDGIGASE